MRQITELISGRAVYLSGPISGLDYDQAVKNFKRAEDRCRMLGAVSVFNPTKEVPAGATWKEAMKICGRAVTSGAYDLMVVLDIQPERFRSEGVKVETDLAFGYSIPVIYLTL